MSSSSDDEYLSNDQKSKSTDSLYFRLIQQQRSMQDDLNKLAELINSTSKKNPIEKSRKNVSFYTSQNNTDINAYDGNNSTASLSTGKGSKLSERKKPQIVRFDVTPGPSQSYISHDTSKIKILSESSNSAQAEDNNLNVSGKYIRIEADPQSGEPILSIFDEAGQAQIACAYLTKDFKLDIDFKLCENKKGSEAGNNKSSDVQTVDNTQGSKCHQECVTPASNYKTEICDCPNWYIWRIDAYAAVECSDAAEWCSEFYLGQPGYRMQAKLEFAEYLVGIYIRLCCGDYDNCLHWPFTNDIYFSILDQTGAGNHIVRVLRPYNCDADEQGLWDRPSDESVECQNGWGLPDFGLRSLINSDINKPSSYLRNDSLYIKISLGHFLSNRDSL